MTKFWNWISNEKADEFGSDRTLTLNGPISEETWWGDEVTPQAFRDELNAGNGPITLWINSPGGDCFAAAEIYNMLKEYSGKVTVKIDSLAASAASVIAMAGDDVRMSPVSIMMIHNPSTIAMGDHNDMQKAIDVLETVKQTIINAYHEKTGLSDHKISQLMEDETWMDAKKAKSLGFADAIIGQEDGVEDSTEGMMFAQRKSELSLKNQLREAEPEKPEDPGARTVSELYGRLELLKRTF